MTKTLDSIPAQVAVMIDANILVYALFPQASQHTSCKHLLERGALGDLSLHIVISATADVIHRAMVLEILEQGIQKKSTDAVAYLKQYPRTVSQLTRYKTILRDITQARIAILPLTYRDLHASRQFRDIYGLLTNDSLIVAVMQRERIQFLATNDTDFERIPGITVRQPG